LVSGLGLSDPSQVLDGLGPKLALLHKSRHEDSLYESSVIAGGYEQLDAYEV